jgi:hypothetical protein
VPKRAMHLGKRRAKRSHKVPPVERRSFAITDGTVTAGYVGRPTSNLKPIRPMGRASASTHA